MDSKAVGAARKAPGYLKKASIYQIFLRAFTREGTLAAAERMLPHVAGLGTAIVYLCPIALQDDDMDETFWSERQRKCGLRNPRNPYRIKDFFAIDPEYGTDDDLKRFVGRAHSLGLKVLLDLVYLHCGPKAVFIDANPDFVKRGADGKPLDGRWHFPELNYESQGLKEHLWRNMEHFIKRFDVDGYRCDVGSAIPLDFWEEGRRRVEALKPGRVMICEGERAEDQLEAFDLNYSFAWEYAVIKLFKGEIDAEGLQATWRKAHDEFPRGARFLRMFDNHDIAHDCGELRHEKVFGPFGADAALALNFFMDGVPFLYNGQEIRDAAPHSIFADKEHGGAKYTVDWSNALTAEGQARMALVRALTKLRKELPALSEGLVEWLPVGGEAKRTLLLRRVCDGQALLFLANASPEPVVMDLNDALKGGAKAKELLSEQVELTLSGVKKSASFRGFGFALLEL